MRQRVREWIGTGERWHVVVALSAALALVSILWTGFAIEMQSCRVSGSPCPSFFENASPLLVALGFAAAGLAAWLLGQAGWGAVFFLLTSGAVAAGIWTEIARSADQPTRWFYLLLAWLAPITFQFHHSLLDRPARRVGRAALAILCVCAVLASLPLLFWTAAPLAETAWFPPLRTGIRLGLAGSLALGWLLLFQEYRRGPSPSVRRRIRIFVFGTLFGFAPFVVLSLIPDTFGAPDHVPFELTFPWLLLSPISYLYSIFRHRLAKSDVVFSRAAVYYLLTILFLTAFVTVVALVNRFVVSSAVHWPSISAALSVALLLLFSPLKRGLEKLLAWVLYGNEITYTSLIGQLAESLAITLDRETLRRLLLEDLPAALRVSRCGLYLRNADNDLDLSPLHDRAPEDGAPSVVPTDGALADLLAASNGPMRREELSKRVKGLDLSAEEARLVAQAGWAYWLPLVSGGVLHGILLVGQKKDGEYFASEDERILATVAHQAAIAVHNLNLMEEVQAGREQLSQAHRQLLTAREREQRRLARELHDEALQSLLGLTFQLASEKRALGNGDGRLDLEEHGEALEGIRSGVLAVVRQLRALVGEMRPAGLEEMGLTEAIGSYVDHLEQEGGAGTPEIRLRLSGDAARIPSPAAICLFRTAQEALRNSVRHAGAKSIELWLHVREHQAELVVEDDGVGFQVPAHFSELANDGHYGVVGMAEQAAWAGGTLKIHSEPGKGTEIRVLIPLNSCEKGNGHGHSSAVGG